jgi:hypothetical protein
MNMPNGSKNSFWGARTTTGQEIIKRSTGIAKMMVNTLCSIITSGLTEINFNDADNKELWEKMAKANDFPKLLTTMIVDTLVVGGGALKITYDPDIDEFPIFEWYAGDKVDYNTKRGRTYETVFKTEYVHNNKAYILYETYGSGYVTYRLTQNGIEYPLNAIPQTTGLEDVSYEGYGEVDEQGNVKTRASYSMAVPVMFFPSSKFAGRGRSIFEGKVEAIDSADEAWSQWMDALRSGRSKEYIPENLLPRNPHNGEVLKPNGFDCRYIQTDSDMSEGAKNQITLHQPAIPHESYAKTLSQAFYLCIYGVLSATTMALDLSNKSLDNAEAQREKEKTTLYTRAAITDALTASLKTFIVSALKSYYEYYEIDHEVEEPSIVFSDYANPSEETRIKLASEAVQANSLSYEAAVDFIHGDSKSAEWKKAETERLQEQRIVTVVNKGDNDYNRKEKAVADNTEKGSVPIKQTEEEEPTE